MQGFALDVPAQTPCPRAAPAGSPSTEPFGASAVRGSVGTRCCLLVPVPPHCQNLSAGHDLQGGDGEEGAEPWSCTSQLSTLRVPAGVGFCGQPWLAGDSPGHTVLVLSELDCGPAVPQFPFMQQRRFHALRRNNADVGLVLSGGGFLGCSLTAEPSSTQPPSPSDSPRLPHPPQPPISSSPEQEFGSSSAAARGCCNALHIIYSGGFPLSPPARRSLLPPR